MMLRTSPSAYPRQNSAGKEVGSRLRVPTSGNAKAGTRAIRADIQGLRGIAVLLVVLFHAWPAYVPGGFVGVDVFFVISGFLITRLLLDELEATGRIRLLIFFERRVRRLLPAASVVLFAVALAVLLQSPATDWARSAGDIVASALYVQNWWLAVQAVDYLGSGSHPSPLLHFWSLSVEEQFYLAWPALLMLFMLVGRSAGRVAIGVGIGVVAAASLLHSILLTEAAPDAAYFATTTRAWEFAAGALVATRTGADIGRIGRWLPAAGLGAILIAASAFHGSTPFPGIAAALPVAGTAAILLGPRGLRTPAARVLSFRPLVYVGGLSYSFYLWHWPVLLLFTPAEAGWAHTLFALLAALALSVVTKVLIEDRFRWSGGERRQPRAWSLAVACAIMPLLASVLLHLMSAHVSARAVAALESSRAPIGAPAIGHPEMEGPFSPPLTLARGDIPDVYNAGCHANESRVDGKGCVRGDPSAAFTLAVVGDSHAAQWMPALEQLATRHRWKIVTYSKSGCPFSSASTFLRTQPYLACDEWNENVLSALLKVPPHVLVTSQYVGHVVVGSRGRDHSGRLFAEAIGRDWRQLMALGTKVVAIRDTPRIGFDVVDCMSTKPQKASRADCGLDRAAAFAYPDPVQIAAMMHPEVLLIDLSDHICRADDCPPVIGNVLVYRDPNHLTATYVRSLAPAMERAMLPSLLQE